MCDDDQNVIKENNYEEQNYLIESSFDYYHPFYSNRETLFGQNQDLNSENSSLIIPNTFNHINHTIIDDDKKDLGKKRKSSCKTKKHDKYTDDNVRRKIKHLILESLFKFINNKIKEIYGENIGKGIFEKQLLKINKKQKSEAKIEHDKKLLQKSIGDIFSVNITRKYRNFSPNQNKKLINDLKTDEKSGNIKYFQNLFNLSFLECLKHYRGEKNILELEGLEGIQLVKDTYKNEEYYLKYLEYYIQNFEKIIYKKKEKHFKKKKNNQI